MLTNKEENNPIRRSGIRCVANVPHIVSATDWADGVRNKHAAFSPSSAQTQVIQAPSARCTFVPFVGKASADVEWRELLPIRFCAKPECTQVKRLLHSLHSLHAWWSRSWKVTQSFGEACVTVLNECDMKTLYQTGFISDDHARTHRTMEWHEKEVEEKKGSYRHSLCEIYENGIGGGRASSTVSHRMNGARKMELAKPLNGNSVKLF